MSPLAGPATIRSPCSGIFEEGVDLFVVCWWSECFRMFSTFKLLRTAKETLWTFNSTGLRYFRFLCLLHFFLRCLVIQIRSDSSRPSGNKGISFEMFMVSTGQGWLDFAKGSNRGLIKRWFSFCPSTRCKVVHFCYWSLSEKSCPWTGPAGLPAASKMGVQFWFLHSPWQILRQQNGSS